MKLNQYQKNVKHKLVSHVYALTGQSECVYSEKIQKKCDKLGIPFTWVDKIPQSKEIGEQKLEDERGILVLLNRKSPFIEKFQHPKGLCHPFFKLTAHNNCNFWCEYCYLYMTFYMRPQSLFYVNYSMMFKEIDEFSDLNIDKKYQILNLGELGDPLATDDITEFSKIIIPYVGKKETVKLLFLTKSTNVDNLIGLKHNERTILSWSLNCSLIAEKLEHKVPKTSERIKSAARASEAGYEIRFRIDPIFWFDGWREQYKQVIDEIAIYTNPSLITLGTYRPTRGLVNHIKSRFPSSNLIKLEEELVLDTGKKRFSDKKRVEMYRYISARINESLKNVPIALCKEPINIWKASDIEFTDMTCNCTDFSS